MLADLLPYMYPILAVAQEMRMPVAFLSLALLSSATAVELVATSSLMPNYIRLQRTATALELQTGAATHRRAAPLCARCTRALYIACACVRE